MKAIVALMSAVVSAFASFAATAETIAIVHAEAWTLTSATPVRNATVVVTDGKITSVVAGAPAPAGARVIDANGRRVTPGLMNAATQLGLLEVSGAKETVDSSTTFAALGASFDVQYAINPHSALIRQARADGLTRALSFPGGSGVPPFSGSAVLLRLAESGDPLERSAVGVFVTIGQRAATEPTGSRAAQWKLLRNALDAARKGLGEPPSATTRTPEFMALQPVLAAAVPLAIATHRESDIRQAIRLAADYGVRVIIVGGTQAWRVARELADAKIPVILDPYSNLPSSFETIGARLDNAAMLRQAGVTIALAPVSTGVHLSYNAGLSIREGAGLAVANGLPYVEGLRAIITAPASIWGIDQRYGRIAPGQDGDLVIWDGDPLEPSTHPAVVLIMGREVSLATRQTELRDRYLPTAGLGVAPPRQ
ncbi:MAG: amidohydrolase family protein [Gammaproteobacteria bacterium]